MQDNKDNNEGTDYTCTVCGYRTAIDDANEDGNIVEHFCRRCTQMQFFSQAKKKKEKKRGRQRRYSYRDEQLAKTKREIEQYCTENRLGCRFVGTHAYIQTPIAEWFFDFTALRMKLYHSNSLPSFNSRTGERNDYHLQFFEFYNWHSIIDYIMRHDHCMPKQQRS